MSSIQHKMIAIFVICIISIAVLITAIDINTLNSYSNKNAEMVIQKNCETQQLKIDSYLRVVEKSISDIFGLLEMDGLEKEYFMDDNHVEEYIKKMTEISLKISNSTEGALAIYFRMNPEITGSGKTGFFYVKSESSGEFEANEVTDLYAYDSNDLEHVGWYYVPVNAGKSVWMSPYYNQNIDVMMVSYVIPFYDNNDNLLGVIGMDIDFNIIMDIIDNTDFFETGTTDLLSVEDRIIYKKDSSGEIIREQFPKDMYENILGRRSSENMEDFKYKGVKYKCSFETLRSGMIVLSKAPVKEIYSFRNELISNNILYMLFILVVIMFFTIRITKKIISPLNEITRATEQYAVGNWDVELKCNTHDELETLTNSILKMANKTKKYIKEINAMAYTDGLTGLDNKTSYIEYTEKINKKICEGEKLEFALLAFDLNNLKNINDNYGHEAGDKHILAAAQMIKEYFKYSRIFRFGGDEFFAILENEDYENREALVKDFYEKNRKNAENGSVVVACGMAVLSEDADNYEELFKIADTRMYNNKNELKKVNKKNEIK